MNELLKILIDEFKKTVERYEGHIDICDLKNLVDTANDIVRLSNQLSDYYSNPIDLNNLD